jgi:hypothetical protein
MGFVDAVPAAPPARPPQGPAVEPGDVTMDVAQGGKGAIRWFEDGPAGTDRLVGVLLGNPRIHRPAHVDAEGTRVEALTIKANTVVVWVDRRGFAELEAFGGLAEGKKPIPKEGITQKGSSASVLPEFLLGVYAEGAVDLNFGEFSLRTPMLYLDPKAYNGLMVEPAFDARSIGVNHVEEKLPLWVRARRARLVARGLLVFDDGQVSTSRASDAVQLRFQTLTVEEYEPEVSEDGVEAPHALGFQSDSSQWFSGRRIQVRGERVPLAWVPRVDFGYSETTAAIAQPMRGVRLGNRSELGYFGFLTVGGSIGDRKDPLLDWTLSGGGYSKRGPAFGVGATWDHRKAARALRSRGYVDSEFVWDHRSFDSNDFVTDAKPRWRVVSEARTHLTPGEDLYVDTSLGYFSDANFNNEFFERDDLQHRDRDSYAHLRWHPERPGNLVGTFDTKWHARDYVTETTQLPEAGFWVFPVPILTPRRRGGFELDLTSTNKAGYLRANFADTTGIDDYEAWRFLTDTLVNGAVDVGDLRVSGFAGVSATAYEGRTDGGQNQVRTAFLGGVRSNLQLHRVYGSQGGWMRLNGLRHIIDLDAGVGGRFRDSAAPSDVPVFDLNDTVRERTAATVRVRNRLQTRRTDAKPTLNSDERLLFGDPTRTSTNIRTVMDLDVALNYYLDDKGPYLQDTPGSAQIALFGEPRPGFNVAGETLIDFDDGIQTGSIAIGLERLLQRKPFAVFAGYRYIESTSTSITADISWRFSEKYAVRLLEVVDFGEGEDLTRIVFRRYSDDHVIIFGANVRNREEVDFILKLETTLGGGGSSDRMRAFQDRTDPNAWGAFR